MRDGVGTRIVQRCPLVHVNITGPDFVDFATLTSKRVESV